MRPDLHIVEGVSGMWHYHLAQPGSVYPLCDPKRLCMRTKMPLADWMQWLPSHIPVSYCKRCDELQETA